MTTNDEPLSTYRASYVAGLERQLAEQREAMAQAVEALEAALEVMRGVPHGERLMGNEEQQLADAWEKVQAALRGLQMR